MRLKKLHIESHKHLENLNFDFVYPDGHPRAGQPLSKICFIGQSATGKTNILELLKEIISNLTSVQIVNETHIFSHYNLPFNGELQLLLQGSDIILQKNVITKNGKRYENLNASGGGTIGNLVSGVKLLYYSAEIISKDIINFFNRSPIDILAELQSSGTSNLQGRKLNTPILEFGQELNLELWLSLLASILDYRKKFTQMAAELINRGTIGDLKRLNKEYQAWAENNKNPLVAFSNLFNTLLHKLNLEVDLVNTQYLIPIKSRSNDEIVPISSLSTGTKGLLLSMFPLFQLNTVDSILLIDEPERSLFPDVQIDLISYYQKLAPKAQIILATHSPFIAAAFEPEERFILYFNDEGRVKVRRGTSPIGDDPNDILQNDFNINYYNEYGKQAYQKYLEIKRKLAKEAEPIKKKELLIELTKLGDKYNF